MLAWFDSDYAGCGSTAAYGERAVEVSQYVRLHFGRRGLVNRCGPLQLSPRNYAASLTTHVIAPSSLVGMIAKVKVVEQTGKKQFTNKKERNSRDNIEGRQHQ